MGSGKILRFRVSYRDKNLLLLAFLRKVMPSYPSVKALKRVIEQKGCEINGKIETYSTHPLREGDEVTFNTALFADKLEKKSIPILHEDADYLICNKPAGLLCEDKEFQTRLGKSYAHVTLVHRLDKDTSGVIILAKSLEAKKRMIELFRKYEVKKEYLAIVDGKILGNEGVLESHLVATTSSGKPLFASRKGDPEAKLAITHWKKEKVGEESSLLVCFPKTGRTHQIRVQLAEMSHPILGDDTYGKKIRCKYKALRQLLHARRIEFIHPISKELLSIESPLPLDFTKAIQDLGLNS